MAVGVCHPLLGDQLAHHEGGCWCIPRYGVSRFVHVAGRALFVGRVKAAGCAASCISSTLAGIADIGIHEHGGLACVFDVGIAES